MHVPENSFLLDVFRLSLFVPKPECKSNAFLKLRDLSGRRVAYIPSSYQSQGSTFVWSLLARPRGVTRPIAISCLLSKPPPYELTSFNSIPEDPKSSQRNLCFEDMDRSNCQHITKNQPHSLSMLCQGLGQTFWAEFINVWSWCCATASPLLVRSPPMPHLQKHHHQEHECGTCTRTGHHPSRVIFITTSSSSCSCSSPSCIRSNIVISGIVMTIAIMLKIIIDTLLIAVISKSHHDRHRSRDRHGCWTRHLHQQMFASCVDAAQQSIAAFVLANSVAWWPSS